MNLSATSLALAGLLLSATAARAEVVLYAADAPIVRGAFTVVSDSTAAGGARIHRPDAGAARIKPALASPRDYFEMSFTAEAGKPYRLWMRLKAQDNRAVNDSVNVQFDGSVTADGSAVYRIGTTSSTEVNLEDCGGCGLSGWGWQDNGWGVGVMGPTIRFARTGTQRIRVQTREDGVSIDQIVLSEAKYLSVSPGALRGDVKILARPTSRTEVVLWGANALGAALHGSWSKVPDSLAADGYALLDPDGGAARVNTPLASPSAYVDLTFEAQAGKPYRLWLRGKAQRDSSVNDSVHVQFSGSVNASGSPVYRIGTTSAMAVNLEECSGCGLSGWGWQDNASTVYFAQSGPQTIRLQRREDGMVVDQIVLSAGAYLSASPGSLENDTVVLPFTQGGSTGIVPLPSTGTTTPVTQTSTTSSSSVKLKVLHWNFHKTRRTDGVVDTDLVVRWIDDLNPDIVSFNEVKPAVLAETVRSKLSARTGETWYSYYQSEEPGDPTNQGVQILSRWPLSDVARSYVELSGYESAVVIKAVATHPTDRTKKVSFFSTHLNYRSGYAREVQARRMRDWARQFPEPRIFVGDMNGVPSSAEIGVFLEEYQDSWARAVASGTQQFFPGNEVGRTRRKRIDFVFFSEGATSLTLTGAQVPDTRNFSTSCSQVVDKLTSGGACQSEYPEDRHVRPSDHSPVIATFSVR